MFELQKSQSIQAIQKNKEPQEHRSSRQSRKFRNRYWKFLNLVLLSQSTKIVQVNIQDDIDYQPENTDIQAGHIVQENNHEPENNDIQELQKSNSIQEQILKVGSSPTVSNTVTTVDDQGPGTSRYKKKRKGKNDEEGQPKKRKVRKKKNL